MKRERSLTLSNVKFEMTMGQLEGEAHVGGPHVVGLCTNPKLVILQDLVAPYS